MDLYSFDLGLAEAPRNDSLGAGARAPCVLQCRAAAASPEGSVAPPADPSCDPRDAMPFRKASRNTRAIITIEGACNRPQGFTYHDLASCHSDYQIDDLAKVDENLWGKAVRLRALVDMAGPLMYAKYLTVESEDGKFAASLPLAETQRTAVIVYDKGGKPLEREDGGPVRFVIPFSPDKCANVKGATKITLSETPGRDTRPSNAGEHSKAPAES